MSFSVQRATGQFLRDVQRHCQDYHYLRRYPNPRSLPFAYVLLSDGQRYAHDGRLFGLVVMKKPQHHRQADLFGAEGLPTAWQVLDLARVWVHPDLQGHEPHGHAVGAFSQMVGRVLRRVQADWLEHHPPRFPELPYHIRLIISYCELSHHDGTAYRACSFERFGTSSDGTKEVYIKRLRQPLKAWVPDAARHVQLPLLAGTPIRHGTQPILT